MSSFRHISWSIPLFLISSSLCFSHEDAIVDHHDRIQINETMTLTQVIALTLEKYPDRLVGIALKQQADALQQRGNSWLAQAPNIAMRYQDDLPGDDIGFREFEYELNLPLWNWGQRSAGQAVAKQAYNSVEKNSAALKLKVAGLVRQALWNMELENVQYKQAELILDISEKLLNKIRLRVELGDLPRSDLLLAQSDQLQKRSLLAQAEAEMMHARKNYINLTQISAIPDDFKEQLSSIAEITEDHPELLAINAILKRKQANLDWVKSAGSGQTNFTLGGKTEKDSENGDDIDSMVVGISIPFGGSAQLAPQIASANLALTRVLAQRDHLFRALGKRHHEAKHALEVTQIELKIANELKQIAESHLKMTRLSFSAGEISLMDLLKIQARSYNAVRHAKEHEVMLQKNIAMYNQAVGVLP